jgi:hypothetical protein
MPKKRDPLGAKDGDLKATPVQQSMTIDDMDEVLSVEKTKSNSPIVKRSPNRPAKVKLRKSSDGEYILKDSDFSDSNQNYNSPLLPNTNNRQLDPRTCF